MRSSFREEETASCGVLLSISWKPEVCWYNRRHTVLLSAPNFKWEGSENPVSFAILTQTLLAESNTDKEEESGGSVFGMIVCSPGLTSSNVPFLSLWAPNPTGEGRCPSFFQPANGGTKLALWQVGKESLGGCLCVCQSEPLEGPLGRMSCPRAPRSGIQVNKHGVLPSECRNYQRDPGSLDLSYRAKGTHGMCARGMSKMPVNNTLDWRQRGRGHQRIRWLDGIANQMDMTLRKPLEVLLDRDARRPAVHGVTESQTWLSSWTELSW